MTDLFDRALEPRVLKLYGELPRLLTHWRLKPLARQFATMEDAVQSAAVGLCKAAERFDANRGVQFSSYAFWFIRGALQQSLGSNRRDEYPVSNGGASVIGIACNYYCGARRRGGLTRSVSSVWDRDGDEDGFVPRELAAEDRGQGDVDDREQVRLLTAGHRGTRNLAIVAERLQGDTLTAIAKRHKISKERVRQICERTIKKLRKRAGVEL